MMSEEAPNSCVVDTFGLHDIASAKSNNVKAVLFEHLESGVLAVPALSIQEHKELYEQEAAEIAPHIKAKIILKKAHHLGAAHIADKLNSGFSGGPYDTQNDLYVGAIVINRKSRVLTATSQITRYESMGCVAIDLETWLKEAAK
jgi:hypothetical protein